MTAWCASWGGAKCGHHHTTLTEAAECGYELWGDCYGDHYWSIEPHMDGIFAGHAWTALKHALTPDELATLDDGEFENLLWFCVDLSMSDKEDELQSLLPMKLARCRARKRSKELMFSEAWRAEENELADAEQAWERIACLADRRQLDYLDKDRTDELVETLVNRLKEDSDMELDRAVEQQMIVVETEIMVVETERILNMSSEGEFLC
jgi:hypothetical protein